VPHTAAGLHLSATPQVSGPKGSNDHDHRYHSGCPSRPISIHTAALACCAPIYHAAGLGQFGADRFCSTFSFQRRLKSLGTPEPLQRYEAAFAAGGMPLRSVVLYFGWQRWPSPPP
jgi:hypothetical protein